VTHWKNQRKMPAMAQGQFLQNMTAEDHSGFEQRGRVLIIYQKM